MNWPVPPSQSNDRPSFIPVSSIQEYLWEKVERGDHAPAAMNMAFSIALKGSVNASILKEVINDIINKVDILRTNFAFIGDKRCQVVRPKTRFRLKIIDYPVVSSDDWKRSLPKAMRRLSNRRFDLEKDILVRARLFRLPDNSAKLFFVIHHLIFDGYSRRMFVDLVLSSYNARINPSRPPPAPIAQYADFALWERSLPLGTIAANQAFWEDKLKGLTPPPLLDRRVTPLRDDKCIVQKFRISASLRDIVHNAAKLQRCSLFLGLCSIFSGVLTKWNATRDLAIWFPCIQRMEAVHANAIGPIYTNLPLRVHLVGDPIFSELMQIVRTEAMFAMEHQWIGANRLQKIAGTRQELGFNFSDERSAKSDQPVTQAGKGDFYIIEEEETQPERHPYDLVLAVRNKDEGLACYLNYNINLFDQSTINKMIVEFCTLAENWSRFPDIPLSQAVAEVRAWPHPSAFAPG